MEDPTRIDLAELRADAGAVIDDGSWLHGKTYIDPDDLLALITVAEAAREYALHIVPAHNSTAERVAERRLIDALARFT